MPPASSVLLPQQTTVPRVLSRPLHPEIQKEMAGEGIGILEPTVHPPPAEGQDALLAPACSVPGTGAHGPSDPAPRAGTTPPVPENTGEVPTSSDLNPEGCVQGWGSSGEDWRGGRGSGDLGGPVAEEEPVEVGKKLEVVAETQVSLRPLDLGSLIVEPLEIIQWELEAMSAQAAGVLGG